ncbi:MAG: hypothetical protein IT445_18375 [Phycisphaeraceae bacterium]|nr:hypothetical protein [Phycisphaeraceae bacterium]
MKSIAAVIVLLLATGVVHAQALLDQVPADALVCVSWAGIDSQGQAYERSKLKAVLEAAQLGQLLTQTLPAMIERSNPDDPDALEVVAAYRQLTAVVWRRPWAAYFAGLVQPNGSDVPLPRLGLICQPGEHEADLLPQLQRLADVLNDQEPNLDARIEQRGDALCLLIGPAGEGSLGASQTYQAAAAKVSAGNALVIYADVAAAMSMVDQIIQQTPYDEQSLPRWHAVRDELGLDGIRQLIYVGGFEDTSWRWEAFLGAPAPRRGVLTALDCGRIDDAALTVVPSGATWMQVSQIDLGKIYDNVAAAIRAGGGPEVVAGMDEALATAGDELGVNVPALLHRFGPRWVMYNDPGVAGPMGLGLCIVNQPPQPELLAADLTTLENYANSMLDKDLYAAPNTSGGGFRFKQIASGDLTIHSFAMPMVSPSWALADGNLYVTLFPQAIVMADLYAKQSSQPITSNAAFTELRDKLAGGDNVTGLVYIDLPQTAPAAYQSYVMLSQTLIAMLPPEIAEQTPGMLLPPLGLILPHLAPAASVGWSDDEGYYARASVPFPGASILSQNAMAFGGGGVSMSAMGVGIMLPALGAARRTARQMQANTQARGIHQACVMYAQENNGRYPDELYPLLVGNYFNLDYIISPMSDVTEPADFNNWSADQQRDWVRANSSYVLIPGGSETLNSETIALFGKPSHHGFAGIPVAHDDNHTTFRTDIDQVDAELQAQTGKTMDQLIAESEQPVNTTTPVVPY